MLLRRIIRSIARQDWGSASIELAIVVLGIFLGLQASSWYEARQELALEEELLARLQSDFDEILAEGDSAIDAHQKVIEGLVILQGALQSGALSDENRDAVVYSLGNVLNADTGAGNSSTYREIVSSGRLRILGNDILVSHLAEYDEMVENAQPLFASFRLMQMEYEKDFHRHVQFDIPEGVDPRGFRDAGVVDFDFSAMQDDPAFRQALSRMTAFQSYFQIWHAKTLAAAAKVQNHLTGNAD